MDLFRTAVIASGIGFFTGLLVVLVFCSVNGRLELSGILSVKGGRYDGEPSPARLNALLTTGALALYYLTLVFPEIPEDIPDVPEGWLVAIGASHGVYVLSKIQALLFDRHSPTGEIK